MIKKSDGLGWQDIIIVTIEKKDIADIKQIEWQRTGIWKYRGRNAGKVNLILASSRVY